MSTCTETTSECTDKDFDEQSDIPKRPHVDIIIPSASKESSFNERIKSYKKNLKYNVEWKVKWKWMVYDEQEGGMFCTPCQKYCKPPAQARGAWVTRPISNWVKTTEPYLANMRSLNGI